MSSPISYDLQGQGGGIVLTDGDGVSGDFRWIQVLTDTEFGGVSSSNIEDIFTKLNGTIPAGVGIGGKFTTINITSGIVIAYRS